MVEEDVDTNIGETGGLDLSEQLCAKGLSAHCLQLVRVRYSSWLLSVVISHILLVYLTACGVVS